ncbi:MAG: Crp/Fnr family transcriptional regulator [Pseudochelatococcus sp.]|jgi:CRP/FNR family cyclic AMP-dependent transcriptional regulator|uniref:Crp/Fnr family transcriptional regulator n=1 Tax=Pseudochelatococcus sp. TaxID=2020869 RepID=UPI003D8B693C
MSSLAAPSLPMESAPPAVVRDWRALPVRHEEREPPPGGMTLADGGSLFSVATEFRALGAEAVAALAASFTLRSFAPQDIIYLQDDDAECLYFIRSGYVRLSYLMEDGSAVLCGVLPPGESFGELGVFEGGTHCDMASAIGGVTVAAVPLHQYRILRERFPEIATAVARVVARRYRSYVELTRMLSLRTLAARLAQALLRLADGLGTRIKVGERICPCVGPAVTQTDLGLMARGARSNVNRTLKGWERERWIAIRDRSIIILNRPRLESLALQEEF